VIVRKGALVDNGPHHDLHVTEGTRAKQCVWPRNAKSPCRITWAAFGQPA
jgi:hypothetical protein